MKSNLFLKIPWTNLYNSAVEVVIEDLNLLVVPNSQVKYDKAKDDKWKQELKQAAVNKVEEAKRLEKEICEIKQKIDDTFAEKLATQIIRNLQVTIKNIHIRYEDRKSNKGKPFTFGLTLSSLLVISTNKDWKPEIRSSSEINPMVYKVLNIDNFCIYWNSNTQETFINLSDDELLAAFQDAIDGKKNYTYMLGPIQSESNLQIDTKPENDDFKIPKVQLTLDLKELAFQRKKKRKNRVRTYLKTAWRPDRKE
ncbi:hypothetical protein J6590_012379 [Homalodisca vitripennis]|nr:hypothetical protein J6590_012379 [Homalodisca vitripennis]